MYSHIKKEEEIKIKVGRDWFGQFDCTQIIGNIDFCVKHKNTDLSQMQLFEMPSLLWAEAKRGDYDIYKMFAQLILTIGKAKTFKTNIAPVYLGVFDAKKIAFIEYDKIMHLFKQNDFDWTVTPSNTETKEFAQIKQLISTILDEFKQTYFFKENAKELKSFITKQLATANTNKIEINDSNFMQIYLVWLNEVKPLIDVDFEQLKSEFNILDSDFYLADLFVDDQNSTDLTEHTLATENLFVTFSAVKKHGKLEGQYQIVKTNFVKGLFKDLTSDKTYTITNMIKYANFWHRFKRPPIEDDKKEEEKIINRRDLLVPQDVRERKGAFFTPQKWVLKSQMQLAQVLGENWQSKYYVWDCAAGTGNLLVGLTNKDNLWASTLDQADVNVMLDRISKGANLYASHVFQFDFLNDEFFDGFVLVNNAKEQKALKAVKERLNFKSVILDNIPYELLFADESNQITISPDNPDVASLQIELAGKNHTFALQRKYQSKVPTKLQDILRSSEKRKKLLIYINPPYAEEGSKPGKNGKTGVQISNIHNKYGHLLGSAKKELYSQFLIRIYKEVSFCRLANFSKLKNLQSPNFIQFRKVFTPKLESLFLMPADTFDNVKGKFPIGFFIWNLTKKEEFQQISADVFDANGNKLPNKLIVSYGDSKYISDWLGEFKSSYINNIGYLSKNKCGNSFQHNKLICLVANINSTGIWIDCQNLIPVAVYLAVRQAITATWLNDRDQFLYPNNSWATDFKFHNDCLAFTLFHGQNRISVQESINHFIPFTAEQLGITKQNFDSQFMTDFLAGLNAQIINPDNAVNELPKITNLTEINDLSVNNLQQLISNLVTLKNTNNDYQNIITNILKINNLNELNNILSNYNKTKLIKLIITINNNCLVTLNNENLIKIIKDNLILLAKEQLINIMQNNLNELSSKQLIKLITNNNLYTNEHLINNINNCLPNIYNQTNSTQLNLFADEVKPWQQIQKRDFSKPSEYISEQAVNVFNAGFELFKFYHQIGTKNKQTGIDYNLNASLYDIREYFQGRNIKGKMNNKSLNEEYNSLIGNLREQLKIIANENIKPKIYEHGFLLS